MSNSTSLLINSSPKHFLPYFDVVALAARTNVYHTALNGLLVAVRLAEDTLSAQTQYSAVRIFSDSQSALGVIRRGRWNDAQRWVKEMVQRVDSKPITFH
jgi:hypothetical protein